MRLLFCFLLAAAPASAGLLSQTLQNALDEVRGQSCEVAIPKWNRSLSHLDWDLYSNEELKSDGAMALQLSWDIRSHLHLKLETLSPICMAQVRELFHSLRDLEDYLGEFVHAIAPLQPGTIDWFQQQPIPIFDRSFYPPYFSNESTEFQFRSGDIMLTRGVSFVSAIISKISDNKSHFSHTVLVHVDENTRKQSTIESYIGSGVALYDMDYALKNENARILVLRPRDKVVAKSAADFMFDVARKGDGRGGPVLYDYDMDFVDPTKLSCAEISLYGYKTASGGAFVLPKYPASILLQNQEFLSGLGLRNGPTFTPGDLENDPRFEMVLDWKDYRLIRDSRYRDTILAEMIRWIGELDYQLFSTPKSLIAKHVVLPSRSTFFWPLVKKLTGAPKIDAHIPRAALGMMTVLDSVGKDLLKVLQERDQQFLQKHHRLMTNKQLAASLDEFRLSDQENFVRGDYSIIHKSMRNPKTQVRPVFGRR